MQKHLRIILGVVVALAFLCGCSETVKLTSKDVSGYVWLPEAGLQEGAGFYLHPDGHIMSVGLLFSEGNSWEVVDNNLILKGKSSVGTNGFLGRFHPVLANEELTIVPQNGDPGVFYKRREQEFIHGDVQYFPLRVMQENMSGDVDVNLRPYLQFDIEGGFVRGFGGVNNFRGSFEVTDISGISFGPMMATRMAGPGMDVEIKLFQCLDLVDRYLAIKNDLYFYQGSSLLCAFSHE